MLKILYKILIIFSCCVVLLLLTVAPVSAAITEETSTYVEVVNDFIVPSDTFSVNYSFGTSYVDILSDIDSESFYDLASTNYDVIERDINDGKYYEYVAYEYTDADISSSTHGVFSYCFYYDAVTLPWSSGEDIYTQVILNNGFLQFYGLNAIIDNVRFSIRSFDGTFVDTTWLYSDLLSSGFFSGDEYGADRFYYYDGLRTISNVKFGSDTAISYPPVSYALCVDFLFRPRNVQGMNSPSIGINTSSNLYLLNYRQGSIVGPEEPGYDPGGSRPELDTPYYGQGNVDLHNMVANAEKQFRDALISDNTFGSIGDFLSTGIGTFRIAFSNIVDMLNYTTFSIPYFEFVIYFSLGMGCIAFILGMAGSIVGASSEPRPEPVNREPSQRFARGIITNKSSGRVSDPDVNNR